MRLKNTRRVLIGSGSLVLLPVFLLINAGQVFSQDGNSPFAAFKGEGISVTTTEMFTTTVILWDVNLSEKEEVAALNQNIRSFLKSLTENSSIKDWKQYLLPTSDFPVEVSLLVNGIDSIAPVYAIRNDQILPDIFLLRSKFIFTGQVEKEWILCFSLLDDNVRLITLNQEILDNDLTVLVQSLTAYPFLKLTSLRGKHPVSDACRIKELNNLVELTCLADKIRELSPGQLKDLNIELTDRK